VRWIMATANDVVVRVRDLIQDPDEVRWTDLELFRWLDDAQRVIIQRKPQEVAFFKDISLVAGAVQTTPADMLLIIDVPFNGTQVAPGVGVTEAQRNGLDLFVPGWQAQPPTSVVQHFLRDASTTIFYVYPPNDASGALVVRGAKNPAPVTASEDVITVPDAFVKAASEYVAHRALLKDSDNANNEALAAGYLTQFYESIGLVRSAPATGAP